MKTTIELPDPLFRQAKAEAAIQGRELKDLVEEGLRLALAVPRPATREPDLGALINPAFGVIESGVPDLASNPEHLDGFGRDASHRVSRVNFVATERSIKS